MKAGSCSFRWALIASVALTFLVPTLADQEADPPATDDAADPWALLRLLEGSWDGAIEGKLGTGRGVREYSWIARGKFLMMRHVSVRLPQEKSPAGDEHEELGVFSFDRERETLVYREFMGEGVVPRSVCEVDQQTVVCTTESVESGPGIRARLRLEIVDRYRFNERYELAWPGRDYELYFTNEWTRVPSFDD
jgi:hypothetical protein